MSTLFASFPKTSKADWVELLQKELKGESLDVLQKFNRVEEIVLPAYFHHEDAAPAFSDPGMSPYTRGNRPDGNNWEIGSCCRIGPGTTAEPMIRALMTGSTALALHAEGEEPISFPALLQGIELEYIHTTLYAKTVEQARAFAAVTANHPSAIVTQNTPEWLETAGHYAGSSLKPFGVNAYSVQQAGGTTWQEIAIALAEGHELLVAQLEAGLTPDEAANNIHFVFGIGNKYFYEIAKFRAFRTAWSRIVETYGAKNGAPATITAQTGFVHTSLVDPYTNLLRQTTEAMSAVVGGADQLVVQPYDWHATEPQTAFTQRMATNISLLLKEESYFDMVADPAGGSYALDNLTNTIAERAWAGFQWIEANGGIADIRVRTTLSEEIAEKAQQRVTRVKEKKESLIGINVFPNPETVTNGWKPLPEAWNGLPALNIETALRNA